MSQTLLLPAFIALFGVVAALFLLGFGKRSTSAFTEDDADDPAGHPPYAEYGVDETFDDDDYVEYTVDWGRPEPLRATADDAEPVTEPMTFQARRPDPEPSRSQDPEPDQESWRSILDVLLADEPSAPPEPSVEPIGFAHNGFHVDDEPLVRPVDHPDPLAEPRSPVAQEYSAGILGGLQSAGGHSRHERNGVHAAPSRHQLGEEQPESRPFWFESSGRHSRDDADDASRYGKHSMPWRD
jgi:hypothetical protein